MPGAAELFVQPNGPLCSWMQRVCGSPVVQVCWEGASKTLGDLLQPSWHGGTRSMPLAGTTPNSCAEQGYVRQESFRRRQMLAFSYPGVIQSSNQ